MARADLPTLEYYYGMLNTTQSDPSQHLTPWLMRHWLLLLAVPWTLYVSVPWLAPVAMQLGARQAADAIYTVYSTQCHQLPERSYFLFGPKTMYSLDEIQAAFLPTNDPLVLRQFNGNETMGWKVAWSDRMVSLYGGVWLAMVLFALVGRRLPRLPVWAFALMLLPMLLDGGSHFLSDVLSGGVGAGFRDSNAWLAALSGQTLPAWFVAGDALGSFNWSLRLLTGLLMAVAVVWFVFPLLDDSAAAARYDLERAQRRAGQSA
jgi:uncharacterized membrane protein